MSFAIEITRPARDHLRSLRKRDQAIVAGAIERFLRHEPRISTRQRKRLEDNPVAPWELRIGSFRVFYDVCQDRPVVVILAIGRKRHDRLFIAGEEIRL